MLPLTTISNQNTANFQIKWRKSVRSPPTTISSDTSKLNSMTIDDLNCWILGWILLQSANLAENSSNTKSGLVKTKGVNEPFVRSIHRSIVRKFFGSFMERLDFKPNFKFNQTNCEPIFTKPTELLKSLVKTSKLRLFTRPVLNYIWICVCPTAH